MLRIGLTGGIGTGKSTVANHFSMLGIDIIDADQITHKLSTPGHQAFDNIIHHFGNEVLNADGTINRKKLGNRAFSDETERKILEEILHPAVRSSMRKAIDNVYSPYCILVIPLLVETGFTELTDRVLVVTADIDSRIKWIRQRSGLSDGQIKSIMAAQVSDEERLKIADDIIENTGSLESLFQQVETLDRKYRLMMKDYD